MITGTSLLLGLGMFSNPVQAADQGQSGAVLTAKAAESESNSVAAEVEKSSIYQDETEVQDVNGETSTIGRIAQSQAEHNNLGVASMFHIFSKETTISADTNGNIATKVYHQGNEFGTRGESHNLTGTTDVNYIEKAESIGANTARTGQAKTVFGKNSDIVKQGHQVMINGTRLDHVKADDVRVEDELDAQHKYIDIDSELGKLTIRSAEFAKQEQSEGVEANFNDMNNRYVDVSKAKKDAEGNVYVDLDAEYLNAAQPVTFKGLSDEKIAPTIIINVKNSGSELDSNTQIKLAYTNNETINSSENHNRANKVLWNFGTELEKLNINSGYFMGSILAPNAAVVVNVNTDGNIVAEKVHISGGESHRWDLQSSNPKSFPHLNHGSFVVKSDPDDEESEDNKKDDDDDQNNSGDDENSNEDETPSSDDPDGNKKDDGKVPDSDDEETEDDATPTTEPVNHDDEDSTGNDDQDNPGDDGEVPDSEEKDDEDSTPSTNENNGEEPGNDNSTPEEDDHSNGDNQDDSGKQTSEDKPSKENSTSEEDDNETPPAPNTQNETPEPSNEETGSDPIVPSTTPVNNEFAAVEEPASESVAPSDENNSSSVSLASADNHASRQKVASDPAPAPMAESKKSTVSKTVAHPASIAAATKQVKVQIPTPVAPAQPETASLPQTGENTNHWSLLGLALSLFAAISGFVFDRKKN